jgi:hypothetical protein
MSSPDSDADNYTNIRKLLDSTVNMQWETESQYWRSLWTSLLKGYLPHGTTHVLGRQ